jgi:hypothetical protein
MDHFGSIGILLIPLPLLSVSIYKFSISEPSLSSLRNLHEEAVLAEISDETITISIKNYKINKKINNQ